MADQQKMDFGGVEAGVQRLHAQLAEVDTIGQGLTQLMTSLGGSWLGDASAAYMQSYGRWKQGYDTAVRTLDEIRANTEATLATHLEAESARVRASTVG